MDNTDYTGSITITGKNAVLIRAMVKASNGKALTDEESAAIAEAETPEMKKMKDLCGRFGAACAKVCDDKIIECLMEKAK
jgi:hypothetical protein